MEIGRSFLDKGGAGEVGGKSGVFVGGGGADEHEFPMGWGWGIQSSTACLFILTRLEKEKNDFDAKKTQYTSQRKMRRNLLLRFSSTTKHALFRLPRPQLPPGFSMNEAASQRRRQAVDAGIAPPPIRRPVDPRARSMFIALGLAALVLNVCTSIGVIMAMNDPPGDGNLVPDHVPTDDEIVKSASSKQ